VQELHPEVDPREVPAGDGEVAGEGRPPHSTTASNSVRSFSPGTSRPTVVPVKKRTPSAARSETRRPTAPLSSFMFGMP
jgi:hypothetical protein